jgi:CubicO group peptidase (beta-lactamase class C family)
MPKDSIFRLASMSKPITAVAVMMMPEEGKLRLNDPISRFFQFKAMKVAVPKPGSESAAAAPGGRGAAVRRSG